MFSLGSRGNHRPEGHSDFRRKSDDVFGFIFQLFLGGETSIIGRELVWPWVELGLVAIAVFSAVVIALLFTTRKALRSDLASVLKGE